MNIILKSKYMETDKKKNKKKQKENPNIYQLYHVIY